MNKNITTLLKFLFKFLEKYILNYKISNRLLATFSVQILALTHGICIGWLSPSIQILTSPQSPLSATITMDAVSWIAALYGLGAFIGNIILILLLNIIGHKGCLLICSFLPMSHCILMYFTTEVNSLYMARIMSGASTSVYMLIYKFIMEIAEPSFHGALTATTVLCTNVGVLMGYILCTQLQFYHIPLFTIFLPIMHTFLMHKFPETPKFLLRKGKIEAAKDALEFYKDADHNTELKFSELQNSVQNELATLKNELMDFIEPQMLKNFLTAFMLMLPISQSFALNNYAYYILAEATKSTVPNAQNYTSILYIGIAQILGTLASFSSLSKFSRKSIYLTLTACMNFGMIALGIVYQICPTDTLEKYHCITLMLFILLIFCGNYAVIAISFEIIAEIMPKKIHNTAMRTSIAILSICVFIALKTFPLSLQLVLLGNTLLLWTLICMPCLVYLYIYLPSTNKQLECSQNFTI